MYIIHGWFLCSSHTEQNIFCKTIFWIETYIHSYTSIYARVQTKNPRKLVVYVWIFYVRARLTELLSKRIHINRFSVHTFVKCYICSTLLSFLPKIKKKKKNNKRIVRRRITIEIKKKNKNKRKIYFNQFWEENLFFLDRSAERKRKSSLCIMDSNVKENEYVCSSFTNDETCVSHTTHNNNGKKAMRIWIGL